MPCGFLQDVLEIKKMFNGKKSISVSNKSKSVLQKSLSKEPTSDKFKESSREIQEGLIRTQSF